MNYVQDLSTRDYTYELPEERIARYPLAHRHDSRLLIARPESGGYNLEERRFYELPEVIPEGAVLVRNVSRVIHARLLFRRSTGALIEVFCLAPLEPTSYELALQSRSSCSWQCMLGNARRWRVGEERLSRLLYTDEATSVCLSVERQGQDVVSFSWDNDQYTFGQILELMGILPLPPYLNRETEPEDDTTYQTVYATHEGSVAAPTAGLHFTPEVLERLSDEGHPILDITLHVGAGTFLPVKSDTIGGHSMHRELVTVDRGLLLKLLESLGRIVAVGTTSVRSLESLYHLGCLILREPSVSPEKLTVEQWCPYSEDPGAASPSTQEAIRALLLYLERQSLEQLSFYTAILIAPGYRWRVVEGLITNFHQPQSTLLLLIAAFVGEDWRRIYSYALEHGFRFLSYGDSSLLWRQSEATLPSSQKHSFIAST